ncbi:MAG: cellulase family glycosylhydrolase [Anaerolineaceae bacterium]|nr:cellulase family glycosylhydrolase [Anaerolineaceae bacterium]
MSEIWSPQKASDWYQGVSPIVGCNYLPRTAVNSTDMWQAQTFDPGTIDEELGWAAAAGYNSLRVFLQYIVWRDDPDGFLQRIDRFLSIAAGRGITAAFILFDDCAFAGREPYLGVQDPPKPGIHNSGWTPSPGLRLVEDRAVWPQLEAYARAIVGAFGQDGRVLLWDLYNEPGNSELGERSTPLVEAAFAWARMESPGQPLTISVWRGNREAGYQDPMSQVLFNSSDIVSFHCYEPQQLDQAIAQCKSFGRPVVCTEWLHRPFGQTVEATLPVFAREQIGWYQWGLVAGRTQTYLDWRPERNGVPLGRWQHDVFHPDGRPYDEAEIELIRNFAFD